MDQYKDEISSCWAPAVTKKHTCSNEEGWENFEEYLQEEKLITGCTKNRTAASQDDKSSWATFYGNGWFVSACRHHLLLWFSGMIWSGELWVSFLWYSVYTLITLNRSKYLLTHVTKAMDMFEDCLLFGSDIGCSLQKTISSSSLVPHFKKKNCKCIVNAFHGYSHNWACQKVNHLNIITGLGIEDLETLERVFSASNAVAAVTHYSTGASSLTSSASSGTMISI